MSEQKQILTLEDRKQLFISGIRNVDSFGEQQIELNSVLGGIDISGEGLKIAELDVTAGEIRISGEVESIRYCRSKEERSTRQRGKNALARLLK